MVAALARLARLGRPSTTTLVMAGRTPQRRRPGHHAGQAVRHRRPTSCWSALERLEELLARYPLRGIKGPVGTAQDMLDLLDGDADRLAELERRVAAPPRLRRGCSTSVGQVYPRSLDFDVVSRAGAGSRPARRSLATTIRLMAGHELVTEGFQPGQVGSSAMPHKMNTRSCERVNGLAVVLRGYLSMVGELAGDQWNEGDVSLLGRAPGRAARRVLRHRRAVRDVPDRARRVRRLPGGDRARARPLPAVPRHHQGADGRGAAPASAARRRTRRSRSTRSRVALAMREKGAEGNDLLDRLAADAAARARPATTLDALVADPLEFTGAAVGAGRRGRRRGGGGRSRAPGRRGYSPAPIL